MPEADGGVADAADAAASASSGTDRSRFALAAFMLGSGILHFVVPGVYARIVPRWLPDARRVVQASGAAELACGALLVSRRTGRLGGWLTAGLFMAVFPANVQMVLDAGTEHQAAPDVPAGRFRALALARLPLQLPLVAWARRVARA
jgi:uncharacterized membrane protein